MQTEPHFFFFFIYLHTARGLYYTSFTTPRQALWTSGIILFVATMATAFLGYVLPWGKMSYWGAVVITNILGALPVVGDSITAWLWGYYVVDTPCLHRFFSLHYLLPFILVALVLIHLALLHQVGSSNPIGIDSNVDMIPFTPYFVQKDINSLTLVIGVFYFILFQYPNILGEPINYFYVDTMKTPKHIIPEWYFLPFYTVVKSIPHKMGGIICMALTIVIFFFMPFLFFGKIRTANYNPVYKILTIMFMVNALFMGWLGQTSIYEPYLELGVFSIIMYFFYFITLTYTSFVLEEDQSL